MCGVVHTSIKVFADRFYEELVRRVYTTPKSYLDLINSYTAKLGALQGAVELKAQQMEVTNVDQTPARAWVLRRSIFFLAPRFGLGFSSEPTRTTRTADTSKKVDLL